MGIDMISLSIIVVMSMVVYFFGKWRENIFQEVQVTIEMILYPTYYSNTA